MFENGTLENDTLENDTLESDTFTIRKRYIENTFTICLKITIYHLLFLS